MLMVCYEDPGVNTRSVHASGLDADVIVAGGLLGHREGKMGVLAVSDRIRH